MSVSNWLSTARGRAQLMGGAAGVIALITVGMLVFGGNSSPSDDPALNDSTTTTAGQSATTTSSAEAGSTTTTAGGGDTTTTVAATETTETTLGGSGVPLPEGMPIGCDKLTGAEFSTATGVQVGAGRTRFDGRSICEFIDLGADNKVVGRLSVYSASEARDDMRGRMASSAESNTWVDVPDVGDRLVVKGSEGTAYLVTGGWGYKYESATTTLILNETQLVALMSRVP